MGDLQLVLRPASGSGNTFLRACSEAMVLHAQLWFEDCTEVGAFPAPPCVHECHVRAYATTDRAVAASGLPGAFGSWTCRVVHDPIHE